MTGLTAARFGLHVRGLVRAGFHADLVLFDFQRIQDTATFDNPISPAEGIEGVWVNGVLAYDSPTVTGARAGRFLARSAVSHSPSQGTVPTA